MLIGSSVADPCDPYGDDTDGDGFCDREEMVEGWDVDDPCSPNDIDLDGDGWCGGMETANGWNDVDLVPPSPPIPMATLCDMEESLLGLMPKTPVLPTAWILTETAGATCTKSVAPPLRT